MGQLEQSCSQKCLAFASAMVCHCVFDGSSAPQQGSGQMWSTLEPRHVPPTFSVPGSSRQASGTVHDDRNLPNAPTPPRSAARVATRRPYCASRLSFDPRSGERERRSAEFELPGDRRQASMNGLSADRTAVRLRHHPKGHPFDSGRQQMSGLLGLKMSGSTLRRTSPGPRSAI